MSNPLGISVNPKNYRLLPQYAAAGISVVEVSMPNLPLDELRAFGMDALSLLKKAGMTLWSVHLPFARELDISEPDEARRLSAIQALGAVIELAREMGAQTLVVHGSSEPNEDASRPARLEACGKSLKTLQALAGDMALAVENLPRSCIGRVGSEIADLAENCAGVCFDVNHLLIQTHAEFLDKTEKRIITTHLSDYDGVNERHWLPGTGIVPWKLVYDRLTAAGYAGPFLFELGLDADGQPHAPEKVVAAWQNAIKA